MKLIEHNHKNIILYNEFTLLKYIHLYTGLKFDESVFFTKMITKYHSWLKTSQIEAQSVSWVYVRSEKGNDFWFYLIIELEDGSEQMNRQAL